MKASLPGVLLIACGFAAIVMSVFVPVLGAMLASLPSVRERLENALVCPGATSIVRDGPLEAPGAFQAGDPALQMSCAYPDGRSQFIRNDRAQSMGVTASFGLAGLCGLVLIVPLAAVTGWLGPRLAPARTRPRARS
jgi:hypothetical protein